MLILHAGNLGGNLTVWGELTNGTPKSRDRPRKNTVVPPYPFAASHSDIFDALAHSLLKDKDVAYHDCKATIWLPTRDNIPIPSGEFIGEYPTRRAKTSVAPWTIMAYRFSNSDAVTILRKIMERRTIVKGIIVGGSFTYWFDALRLASLMVTQQQFLPDLTEENDSYHAVWRPIFTGRYVENIDKLAGCMPAVCRAITLPDAKYPPKTHPVDALASIITGLVDGMVRDGIVRGPSHSRSYGGRFDNAHDEWLHALSYYDGKMDRDKEELARFAAHVHEWNHPVAISSKSSFRLCFRLVEPKETKGSTGARHWNVQYLVNPHNDPSLLIPADDVWNKKVKIPGSGAYGGKENLLISLGQASELSDIIATGLKTGNMSGFAINTATAHKFLTEDASALERVGYGIILPSWWVGGRTKTRIAVRADIRDPEMRGTSGISMNTLVQFDWEVALGDKKITQTELERLAKIKMPLVKIRGQWIDANSAAIQSAIDMLKKAPKKATMREAIMMKLKEETDAQDMPHVTFTSSADPVNEVFGGLVEKNRLEKLDQPDGFSGTLRPYQIRGYSWLAFLQKWGLGGCLADDMGLGKTIQMLALVQRYVKLGGDSPILIVCPMSLIENWRKETAKFAPDLSVLVHHGTKRKTDAEFKRMSKKHALVISSYGLIQRDISFIRKVKWGGIVLDEAQNIKNHDTKQARAVRMLDTEFRFAMTGTPVENNVGDLWSIMDFLNPGFLGTQKDFIRDFFVPIQMGRDGKVAENLRHITGPFVLRRLKTDKSIITDLPDKVEIKVYCQLTKEQASLYSSVLKEIDEPLESAEGIQRKGIILGVISKLKQICNHPAQFFKDNTNIDDRSGKLSRLTEMLAEAIDAGDRILIFTQFAEMGYIIQKHVQETFGLDVPFLHGGVSRNNRARMVEYFQDASGDGPRVFVLSLKAGGTGLNLTAANRVIHFDRWWNPAVEDQATDRAFRIGQTQNVQVHKFICAGTLEEKIDEMIERKKQISKEVVGVGEKWITELSNDDLRDVLSLTKGAAVM